MTVVCFELRRPLTAAVNSNASIFELYCGGKHALLTQDGEPETLMWIFEKNIFMQRFVLVMFSMYGMCFSESNKFIGVFFQNTNQLHFSVLKGETTYVPV